MAGKLHKLSARTVASLTRPGRHSDGGGLYLFISRDSEALRRRWVFRFAWVGKTREMGLGPAKGVSLAEVRKLAAAARNEVANGRDPIEDRDAGRRASRGRETFGECAVALIAAKESEWRNARHRQQWRVTLETYCAPMWAMSIDEPDTEAVLAVLRPLWQTRAETASRLRGRIEAVLDAAKAQGLRQGENPARWRGHLDKLLPKRGKLTRGHHAAMAYNKVPELVARLRGQPALASPIPRHAAPILAAPRHAPPSRGEPYPAAPCHDDEAHYREPSISAMALEFLILTAARSGEVLGACWPEIDLEAKVWTIPASRMKAAREHRVPLSGRAMAILARLDKAKTGEFVFFGQRPGKPLSPASLTMVLRRMKVDGVTVHGFRSAFRDWAGNETHFPRELAEAALAHVIGDKSEQAYRRGDALEKRRELMEAWSAFCEPGHGSNVVPMPRKA